MKHLLTGCISIFIFVTVVNTVQTQDLDLSNFELVAHYELLIDGSDLTGNYDPIALVNPVFDEEDGLLCRGCYTGFGVDSCVIVTPNIDDLSKEQFVIQVDFRPLSFSGFRPVFSIGKQNRALSLHTSSAGAPVLVTNDGILDTIPGIAFDTAVWYNLTIMHDRSDSTTQVFVDDQLIYTNKSFLDFKVDLVISPYEISSSNFGYGQAFHGYWKNLKVYAVGATTSNVSHDENESYTLYPNPVKDELNINHVNGQEIHYTIYNAQGAILGSGHLVNKSISVSQFSKGIYLLMLLEENQYAGSFKFIKH